MISSLTAEKLACARGERRLFDGLSFRVRAGQALAVEGANGAGKTSLLRLIAGFLAPAGGRILVKTAAGESDDGEERGRLVGWLGHQDGLKPQLTVHEQLGFFARLYGSAVGSAARAGAGGAGAAGRSSLPLSFRRPEAPSGAGAASGVSAGRSGCWMSLSRRWMRPARRWWRS